MISLNRNRQRRNVNSLPVNSPVPSGILNDVNSSAGKANLSIPNNQKKIIEASSVPSGILYNVHGSPGANIF